MCVPPDNYPWPWHHSEFPLLYGRWTTPSWINTSHKLLLDRCMHTLEIEPGEQPLVCTEPLDITLKDRELLCELVFERYEFPSYNVQNSAVAALFSEGMDTGVVVECGECATTVVGGDSSSEDTPRTCRITYHTSPIGYTPVYHYRYR